MIGIENVQQFYTTHYMAAILAGDIKPVADRWAQEAKDEQHGRQRTPMRELSALQAVFFRYRERLERLRVPAARVEAHKEMAAHLLHALGYRTAPLHRALGTGPLPLLCERRRASGEPLLWVLPVASSQETLGEDPLSLPLLPEQQAVVPEPPTDLDLNTLGEITAEMLATEAFGLEDPPRFVLIVGDTQWILADRSKWAEQRMLRFDWAEILGRRDDPDLLNATAALLHQECLAPDSGTALVDSLDDSSHKHAFEVSEDLKYALRECIELLGNEAIRYRREVSKKKVYGEEIDGDELARECLRYMYRLLFLLYVEARPELGYAPMGAEVYLQGYSLTRLRDLETVELQTDEARQGFYIHGCLKRLFTMVYDGSEAQGQQSLLGAGGHRARPDIGEGGSETSLHHTFRLVPLRAHLFDPARTPFLNGVRIRDEVLLRVIKLMSLSRPQKVVGRKGKSKRRGRISYATLGINQLGAVYEALLSFRGFFAEHTLYEVKPAKADRDPLAVAYFVTEEQLPDYGKKERVYHETGDMVSYAPGSFIYRQAGRDRQKSASYYTPEVLTRCLVKYALKELLEDEAGKLKLSAAEILKLTICEPAMGSAAFLNEAINQLAERYLQARQLEMDRRIPHDQYLHELQRVRMYLADNNVYGVDLNPVALELAEVSLWLNAIFARRGQVFVPWFGGQLCCGNSLVGAWRKVFSKKELASGRGNKESPWLDSVPERIPLGEPRPEGSAYHFLLPDRGMAVYGEGSEGKPIREMCKAELAAIKAWRNEVIQPLSNDDRRVLAELSDAADRLWERHTDLLRRIRQRTTDPFSVYGFEHPLAGKEPTTTEEKDRIWQKEMQSEQVRASSPYRRLKLAMDYWCALWFWPIQEADLLPDREEWLTHLGLILASDVRPSHDPQGQMDLFAPTMDQNEARKMTEELGFVDVEKLVERIPQLQVVERLAEQYRFHHWELEFADVFADRGGFDLILGNPPWIKVEWKEAGVMGDYDPSFALKEYSSKETADRRQSTLEKHNIIGAYLHDHEECAGILCVLSAAQNYPHLERIQPNLYKCFMSLSWDIGRSNSISGLLHPEGAYTDPKGKALRRAIYPRLRRHYQFRNEFALFKGTNDHGRLVFSLNVYGPHQDVGFLNIANLYLPSTIEDCHSHSGEGPIPGLKTENNKWNTAGHRERIILATKSELALYSKLFEEPDTSHLESRLPALHATPLLSSLQAFSEYQLHLSDEPRCTPTYMWDESRSKKAGIIKQDIRHARNLGDLIYSGPHFNVGNPLFQSPRRVCIHNSHYDSVDLQAIPDDYLPRTKYVPAASSSEYHSRTKKVDWTTDGPGKITDYYRLITNRGLSLPSERTLQPAIAPREVGHIDGVYSYTFADERRMVQAAATWMSLPVDFFVKATGAGDCRPNLARRLPIALEFEHELRVRACSLNCLTLYYADLWEKCFNSSWTSDAWAILNDPLLNNGFHKSLTTNWDRNSSLRSDYERRMVLVEIDVLASMALGYTLQQLLALFRVQFPVLRHYEQDTWYDVTGRIIFTNSKSLVGVGLPRSKSKTHPEGPYWEDVQDMTTGTVTQVKEDDTLPGGPYEKSIEYVAPWVRCDREADYRKVWAAFEERFGGRS